ncbi:DUF4129 domain-containing protein [Rhodococcus sp. D2-41]|uniref:DUF4129 domain-containing protein n=1 Tax=Speluncibacter jeojiensis TaxID=2710754 RepID=A0A9X4M1X0_9ACTN|nr:DUF4129 domain-containing protein [Rhodococcus sp. D2-41]MDG3009984.1 DUF4129 domain-containing protein [Rhodococcus sp. D2-41]MDG3016314.1 DUF4129 domain-containing protein [Corynebacteriales bacterium D3-21]
MGIAAVAVVLTGALLLPLIGHVVGTPARPPSASSTSQIDRPAPSGTTARDANGVEAPPRTGSGSLWTVSLIALPTLLALMTAGALLGRRRVGADAVPVVPAVSSHPASEHENLTRAAELGLAVVAASELDARSAIIACYAAMEAALAGTADAAPQESDTPTEVLARAVARGVVREESAAALVRLFSEARFSAHPMTERHRALAASLLRATLDDLRSRACVP